MLFSVQQSVWIISESIKIRSFKDIRTSKTNKKIRQIIGEFWIKQIKEGEKSVGM